MNDPTITGEARDNRLTGMLHVRCDCERVTTLWPNAHWYECRCGRRWRVAQVQLEVFEGLMDAARAVGPPPATPR